MFAQDQLLEPQTRALSTILHQFASLDNTYESILKSKNIFKMHTTFRIKRNLRSLSVCFSFKLAQRKIIPKAQLFQILTHKEKQASSFLPNSLNNFLYSMFLPLFISVCRDSLALLFFLFLSHIFFSYFFNLSIYSINYLFKSLLS